MYFKNEDAEYTGVNNALIPLSARVGAGGVG